MAASEQRQPVVGTEVEPARSDTVGGEWGWLRYPELWIAVALGAVLRLWAIGSTTFLFDQATLMTLARDTVLRHLVPVASLTSSINTLNPPLNVYLLMPFALFGANPLPAVVALALWNVLGVALCYLFALRYFGRRIAAVASLLFAAGPTAVFYSRFLWPQNYLPPLVALYGLAVYAGCIRGRRGMLVPAVALLTLGALLHPTMLLLLPALFFGVALAPHRPRWREYAVSAVIVAVLLSPTLVWEIVSGWSDVRLLAAYSAGHAKIDPEVLFRLYEALGAPGLPQSGTVPHAAPHSLAGVLQLLGAPITDPLLGSASPYAALGPTYVALGLAAILLFAVGWVTLTVRIILPARSIWRNHRERADGQAGRLVAWAWAIWHRLRADATWRAELLLWLLVTAPLVLLIRHSSAIFPHYLIVLYPFAFLTMAMGLRSLWRAVTRLAARVHVSRPAARALLVALVAALVCGQAAQAMLYAVSVGTGQFDARVSGYGYPLDALQEADARLRALQRQAGATSVYIAETSSESVPMDYALVREHADRVGFVDDCLVLPPPDAGPALVVAARGSQVESALAALPVARLLAEIPMAGNAPLAVYRVAGGAPTGTALPGETPFAPVRFGDASGQGLQLDAGQIAGGQVRLRWTALGSTPAGAAPLTLRTLVHDVNAAGQVGAMRAFRDCAPTRWQAGDTVFTWLPLPPSWSGRASGGAPDTLLVQAQESTATYDMPAAGPMRLLSSEVVYTPWNDLTPQLAGQSAGVGAVGDGGVLLNEGTLGAGNQ